MAEAMQTRDSTMVCHLQIFLRATEGKRRKKE